MDNIENVEGFRHLVTDTAELSEKQEQNEHD